MDEASRRRGCRTTRALQSHDVLIAWVHRDALNDGLLGKNRPAMWPFGVSQRRLAVSAMALSTAMRTATPLVT